MRTIKLSTLCMIVPETKLEGFKLWLVSLLIGEYVRRIPGVRYRSLIIDDVKENP